MGDERLRRVAGRAVQQLLGLGFSAQEAEALLDGAPGDTPEALIAHALKVARK